MKFNLIFNLIGRGRRHKTYQTSGSLCQQNFTQKEKLSFALFLLNGCSPFCDLQHWC